MAPDGKVRLDQALVARGLAQSRSQAKDLISRRCVAVNGTVETKTSRQVSHEDQFSVDSADAQYVSRAAGKLVAGLDHFNINPAGLSCLDIGASTGGFTQVLIERGAAHVIALDVGHGQLHPRVASLENVTSLEKVNARNLTEDMLAGRAVELVVSDVSFISLKLALPPALQLARTGAHLIALIKPQFEAGKGKLGKGGIVRDETVRAEVCAEIARWLQDDMGCQVLGTVPSPVVGSDGNQEFLIAARKP